jgi:hypothetical protein
MSWDYSSMGGNFDNFFKDSHIDLGRPVGRLSLPIVPRKRVSPEISNPSSLIQKETPRVYALVYGSLLF